MKLWLSGTVMLLVAMAIGTGFYATRLYEKSIFLGFITTLLAIIIPFFLFLGFIYIYGLYHNGYPLQFKW